MRPPIHASARSAETVENLLGLDELAIEIIERQASRQHGMGSKRQFGSRIRGSPAAANMGLLALHEFLTVFVAALVDRTVRSRGLR
jgi:hypothetical protein